MSVTLMRHAVSKFNEGNTTDKDCDLSQTGVQQANKCIGEFDIVITSGMKRSRRTLSLSGIVVKKRHIECDLFREMMYGSICDYLECEDGSYMESEEDVQNRVRVAKEYLRILLVQNPNARILVITHACFIRRLTGSHDMINNCQWLTLDV